MTDETDETPEHDYVEELNTLEAAAFAADVHKDGKRGVYSIEAMRDFYRKTVRYFDEDHVLREALDRAESNYAQGENGPGSASLLRTMKKLGEKYLEILSEKMTLPEAYAYLTEGEESDEETRALFNKYAGKTWADVKDKLDEAKTANILNALMQYRFDKLIPDIEKRIRDSRVAYFNRLRLENIVESEE